MGIFLSYSIISGLILLVLYLTYRLFLARDNQHSFNRGVLLGIYFVSFLTLPAISLGQTLVDNLTRTPTPATESVATQVMPVMQVVETISIPVAEVEKPIWGTILIWLFIAGMAVVALRTVMTWYQLITVIRTGKKIPKNGYSLVLTDNERFAPFSWMHYVVITPKDLESNFEAITAHELKHIACRHWIDLLIAQVVCTVNWFNPASWLMRDELMLIHEYQADMAVIDQGHDPQEYQLLLIKKAVGMKFPSLANSLNHSKLKKRITMMYREKSGAGRKFKALVLVPMLAVALGLASIPVIDAAVSTIRDSEMSANFGEDDAATETAALSEGAPSREVAASETKAGEATADVEADGAETADATSQTEVAQNSDAVDTSVPEVKEKTPSFRLVGFSTDREETRAILTATVPGRDLSVSGGALTTDGETIQATDIAYNLNDDQATITVSYPPVSRLYDPVITLNVNGQTVAVRTGSSAPKGKDEVSDYTDEDDEFFSMSDFEEDFDKKFFKKHMRKSVIRNGASRIINNNDWSSYAGGMKIIVNGKEPRLLELENLDESNIATVSFDMENNQLIITTKK